MCCDVAESESASIIEAAHTVKPSVTSVKPKRPMCENL